MRKFMKIFIVLFLIITMLQPAEVRAAVKLSKAKATMEIDSTLKLKISGIKESDTIIWKTSKKSVATVSKAGTITAKAKGQATITATVNNKQYECVVKVVNSNTKEFTLAKGVYIVGEDIDPGKYDLLGTYDWCRVTVYSDEDEKDRIMSEIMDYDESPTYSNLRLEDGNKLEITYGGSVLFKKK